MLLHEDYPHTVPSRAFLVWRENWFFVFMDPERDVSCLVHLSARPTTGDASAAFTLIHAGHKFAWTEQVVLPSPFVNASSLKFGLIDVHFLTPQSRFQIRFEDKAIKVEIDFEARMHLFDFQACADVNPDLFSLSENTAMARNEFRHQGQSVQGRGSIAFKSGAFSGQTITVNGSGYRDHSWGMRNDALTLDHNWTFVNFPDHVFHFFSVRNTIRRENVVMHGYVGTKAGNCVLKTFSVETSGLGEESMPGTVVFKAKDVSGASHTVTCDVANAFARLPVAMTKPGENIYHCVENMCRCTYEEQGATGLANVEIGKLFSSSGEPLPSQNSEMRIAQREP